MNGKTVIIFDRIEQRNLEVIRDWTAPIPKAEDYLRKGSNGYKVLYISFDLNTYTIIVAVEKIDGY